MKMGNCLQPADPEGASIPRDILADTRLISRSSLPIVFLIGGPGAGKRTQSTMIAKKYGFLGINANDVVREEVSKQTARGVILGRMMSEGKAVPPDVLLDLIRLKMLGNRRDATQGFLLSGFPRCKDQSVLFERTIRAPDLVLYLVVRESLLRDRVMARTITAAQRREYIEDDVKERIRLFSKSVLPILRHFKKKLALIDGEKDAPQVFQDICHVLDDLAKKSASATKLSPATSFLAEKKNERSPSDTGQVALYP